MKRFRHSLNTGIALQKSCVGIEEDAIQTWVPTVCKEHQRSIIIYTTNIEAATNDNCVKYE